MRLFECDQYQFSIYTRNPEASVRKETKEYYSLTTPWSRTELTSPTGRISHDGFASLGLAITMVSALWLKKIHKHKGRLAVQCTQSAKGIAKQVTETNL